MESGHVTIGARDWQEELGLSLRTAEELHQQGFIEESEIPRYRELLSRYKFLLPRHYAALIDREDPGCPIRRQAIPSLRELAGGGKVDPLTDLAHRPSARVTHRYRNRVLLHPTPNCSMYCRYCFRKTLLNEAAEDLFAGGLREGIAYVKKEASIHEVILSGGDPFLLGDAALGGLVRELAAIPHLRRLRVHTRVPVTFPQRVTEALVERLTGSRLPVVVVTHFNHPRECTPESDGACARLRRAGVTLFNQSVLLRGVNDSSEVLAELSERLFETGIVPYYLHHPDPARGTAHFDLSMAEGRAIHEELKRRLPGYLVPRYVVDDVGAPYKVDVSSMERG